MQHVCVTQEALWVVMEVAHLLRVQGMPQDTVPVRPTSCHPPAQHAEMGILV